MPLNARRVTRSELYALVWQKPMNHLAEEFGITGNGLAKICDRMDVPYPPRGYWAKKEAGKPVVSFRLPPRSDGIPETTDIYPTPPKPVPLPEADSSAKAAVAKIEGISVPDGLDQLHPRVQAWLADHRKAQRERELEARRHGRDSWYARTLIRDLTERDLYRFRVTSAVFTAVERAGGKIETERMIGKVTFLIDGHRVEASIVEKMLKSLRPREQSRAWTAYPDHHQMGLESSGFLRVSITTYIGGRAPQWLETDRKKIGDMLPEIVGTIMAAGPILDQEKRERDERDRLSREAEARRYEARRLKEIDDKRWAKFGAYAAQWDERARLLPFLEEIERRMAIEGDVTLSDRTLSDWITWAKGRIEALDPLSNSVAGMFDAISRVTQWS